MIVPYFDSIPKGLSSMSGFFSEQIFSFQVIYFFLYIFALAGWLFGLIVLFIEWLLKGEWGQTPMAQPK
jgi:hypothetical protein